MKMFRCLATKQLLLFSNDKWAVCSLWCYWKIRAMTTLRKKKNLFEINLRYSLAPTPSSSPTPELWNSTMLQKVERDSGTRDMLFSRGYHFHLTMSTEHFLIVDVYVLYICNRSWKYWTFSKLVLTAKVISKSLVIPGSSECKLQELF